MIKRVPYSVALSITKRHSDTFIKKSSFKEKELICLFSYLVEDYNRTITGTVGRIFTFILLLGFLLLVLTGDLSRSMMAVGFLGILQLTEHFAYDGFVRTFFNSSIGKAIIEKPTVAEIQRVFKEE